MSTLEGKTAVITGASSGIGEATARALAADGAAVVLAARREDRLQSLSDEITAEGGQALVAPADVTDRSACERLVEAAVEAFGRLDIFVNNAGLMPLSYVQKLKVEEWDRMLDVNVRGVLYCTAAALPQMMEQGSGHFVNVSSVAGRRTFPGGAVYCATKFAVRAFSDGVRNELAPKHNIRVTTIEPGTVATELTDTITDEDIKKSTSSMFERMTPLESEDVAEAIRYAVAQPNHVNINQVLVMPREQRF